MKQVLSGKEWEEMAGANNATGISVTQHSSYAVFIAARHDVKRCQVQNVEETAFITHAAA